MDTYPSGEDSLNDTLYSPTQLMVSPYHKNKLYCDEDPIKDYTYTGMLFSPRYPTSCSSELNALPSQDDFQSNMSVGYASRTTLSKQPSLAGLGILLDGILSVLGSVDTRQLLEHEGDRRCTVSSQGAHPDHDSTMTDVSPMSRSLSRTFHANSEDTLCGTLRLTSHLTGGPLPCDRSFPTVQSPVGCTAGPIPTADKATSLGDTAPSYARSTSTEPPIGLFPDVNMRTILRDDEPVACVNPASIMGPAPVKAEFDELDRDITMDISPEPSVTMEDAPPPPDSDIPSASGSVSGAQSDSNVYDLLDQSFLKLEEIAQEVAALHLAPPASVGPAALHYPTLHTTFPACEETKVLPLVSVTLWGSQPAKNLSRPRSPLADLNTNQPPVNRGPILPDTPILNAHLGVDIEVLRAKVERHRLRNPDQDIDNAWFLPFVGKLTPRGELLEDYRCYILGCNQTNKRRDHIVTHVGSHVDHRPYECAHCGQRFLRKNECKRHEARHADDYRSFTCKLCPASETKSYSRQDTLKRHMTKAHGASAASKEKCGRKKARTEHLKEEGDGRILGMSGDAYGWP
ncbi:hypothetical protein GLOTRDRAFT_125692 [Gloeophyllum trabeum ATCC 11539]|uniref:C2H2-type domain-containing protein n=1 Tax=Gloeophyllum trabeum (strain ATCC 11539 / FP-39264 / Madison 617) TaxID=670483 RepID=S7RWW0_GLOTA|nr:uncharacterized protein GLOTRDRAFT_125692 [Gloeophyllum trabeum ATCC 11539]EPQ59385.1 hypothetical protein GLOTRDRAFT_125692 [Gloeophyllum trabeum ATCC 11539]